MADIQHSVITDPHIHEPKGASTASNGTVYVANGAGSGTWKVIEIANLDYDALLAAIQSDVDNGDLDLNGRYWVTAKLEDVSTASSVIIPILRDSTVVSASVVLGGTITTSNASVSFKNSSGASMGSPVTIVESGSAKGDQYAFTATGNNVLTGPTWIEISSDGASDTAQPLFITVELSTVLNP
jgi:hypothetical protein